MAKITRKKLARGVKLVVQHAFTPLEDAATEISGNLQAEQIAPQGVFRVNHHIPILGRAALSSAAEPAEHMVPFTLPPPQEFFSFDGKLSTDTPRFVLDEFNISFDQRDEPAVLNDAGANDKFMAFGIPEAYDFKVRLLQKNMRTFDISASYVPERELFSLDFDGTLFDNTIKKPNPFNISDLDIVVNPYKTYVLALSASDEMYKGLRNKGFISLQTSMKFKSELMLRDSGSFVQNLPTEHSGSHEFANISSVLIQTASSDTTIQADTATGFQSNLEVVDQLFVDKFKGGYKKDSHTPVDHHVKDDATYFCTVIPMFSVEEPIVAGGRAGVSGNYDNLPYIGIAPHQSAAFDRRIIPLQWPVTIHNVTAIRSFAAAPEEASTENETFENVKPYGTTFKTEIGVGLGSGIRHDEFRYQQVAYATFDQVNTGSFMIDAVKQRELGTMSDNDWDWELFNIPLVYADAGVTGSTWMNVDETKIDQGNPVFAGLSSIGTMERMQIASTTSGTLQQSVLSGSDQFIEARWSFVDSTNGLSSSQYPDGTVFVGSGGNWLIITGKKHLL